MAQSCLADATHGSEQQQLPAVSRQVLEEYDYVDSTTYRPDKQLILAIKAIPDAYNISIHIFQKAEGLRLYQAIDSLDSRFGNSSPIFEDFNEDGLADVKIGYGSGARGANELYHLLLQDAATGKLSYVKGSAAIPNLSFDRERNTITAEYYYGGTSFIDLRLQNDSLVEIRGVNVSANNDYTFREFYEYDEKRKRVLIKRDSVQDGGEGLYSRD